MKRWGMVAAQCLGLLMMNRVHAAGLGVPADQFVTRFVDWIPSMLFLAALIGIVVWYQSSSDYNQGMLSGSSAWISRTAIAGGAVVILGMMGLAMGATLH